MRQITKILKTTKSFETSLTVILQSRTCIPLYIIRTLVGNEKQTKIYEMNFTYIITFIGKSGLLLDTMDRERLSHLSRLETSKTSYKVQHEESQITKPVFTTALKNVTGAPENSTVHLECRLEPLNDPNLKVEWYCNGKAIKAANRMRTTHDFGYVSLDILNAYKEDNGTYMCKATNQLGEAVNTCSVEVISGQSLIMDSQHPEGMSIRQF